MSEGWDGWGHWGFEPDGPHDGLASDPLAHDVHGVHDVHDLDDVDGVDGAAQRYHPDWPDGAADRAADDEDPAGPVGPAEGHDSTAHLDPAGGQPVAVEHHPVGGHGGESGTAADDGNAGESGPVSQVEGWELSADTDAAPFPPRLELDVTPADGLDWVDVRLLGGGDLVDVELPAVHSDPPEALLADLHRLDGADGAPSWADLSGSDDPVVRALARFWQR